MKMAANQTGSAAPWRFMNSGFHAGAYNMQVDELLASALLRGDGLPTLRVYGWAPHALSLGYHQPLTDIDQKRCAAYGIDVVRRPTGGRAILHADEVTYSVVMAGEGKSVSAVYAEISQALVAGLRSLGADVDFVPSQPDFVRLYQSRTSIPCFSSSGRYEIQYRGRKLVGSAQRRYTSPTGHEVVLQHGSILLGPGHQRLSELIDAQDIEFRRSLRLMLETKTTDLASILGREVLFVEVAAAIRIGFAEAWSLDLTEIEGAAIGWASGAEPVPCNYLS
jgi:lipoate-protein ligase A